MRMTRPTRRPAAVLPLVTVCLVGLLAFVALAIDVGMMAVARTQAQAAADIAALAGARTLDGSPGNNRAAAEAEAREAARANAILGAPITEAQVATARAGVYRYSPADGRFAAEFDGPPTSAEAYGVMQVVLTSRQETFVGKMLGLSAMDVGARATAAHRPRDIAISLDFSSSMRSASRFNYPPPAAGADVIGGLNPDDRYPRFGPWALYPVATSQATSNPMHFGGTAYVDAGGEAHAANNLTVGTPHGPPVVANFQTTAADHGPNAFVYNGDLTGASFNLANKPVCTPAPASWSSQYAPGYDGDRWPVKKGSASPAPALADYARHVADVLHKTRKPVGNDTADPDWEKGGYDLGGLTFTNGPFKGYVMGPGYFGKTFYMWPPDPRYTAGADPTNLSADNPIQDAGGCHIADWRKRFFLYPSDRPAAKGKPMDDNSRLWNTARGSVGIWRDQGLGGTVQYVPHYDAILAWLKAGPQTLPPALRAGRVLYYSAIPDAIPMNWRTGLIDPSATADQRFWKEYIDFVLGAGRHPRARTLYGSPAANTWGGQTFADPQITPRSALTGSQYMHYTDAPVHPRLHTWFGPLTMLAFLTVDSDAVAYNWFAGTTAEAQTWQLKAGIRSALEDIKRNHPNDLATLNFWSSHDAYATPRVPMGKDFDRMRNCLYYPYSLVGGLGAVTAEKRPYKASGAIDRDNPCGLDTDNYVGDIPLADGGTNPSMGLMLAYNQFNWSNGYAGRNGAAKIVILETDGVANAVPGGTFRDLGPGGRYQWAGVRTAGLAPKPFNGHPDAMNPAVSLAWLITQDVAGTRPWPKFPAYTSGPGLAAAPAPVKWSGISRTGPGYSTPRNPARVHAIAFGELFEPTTTSALKTRGLEFLRNVQIAGGTQPEASAALEGSKVITGTATERIGKLKGALERIMQGGIQVALIE